jgi:amidase
MGLLGKSALEIAGMVKNGQVSPREVVQEHLNHVAGLDDKVRAFQLVRAEKALAEADELAGRSDLRDLPLAGVPVAIKDDIDVAGEPTRNGTVAHTDAPAPSDDELVRRLRAAGCIVIGKTRVPELCLFHFTESQSFGLTRNPWNLERGTGGSSGGSAAALSAGMVPLSLSADGLGSIRIPSAWCGVFGIKPGAGVTPRATAVFDWFGLAEYGPTATTVADAAVALDALAASNKHSPVEAPTQPLRLALSYKPPATGVRLHREIRVAVEAGADALRGAGHTITVIDPPYPQSLVLPLMQRWFISVARDAASDDYSRLEKRTQSMFRIGRWLDNHRPVRPETGERWRQRVVTWLQSERIDALLLPSTARLAPPSGKWMGKGWVRTVMGGTMYAPYGAPWNLAGLPAASVPAGLAADGTPMGMQIMSGPGQEPLILSIAKQLEELRPWPRHAPFAGVAAPADQPVVIP